MKIGADIGSTLAKFAWEGEVGQHSGERKLHLASSADEPIESIISRARIAGATSMLATGIRRSLDEEFKPLTVTRLGGNPIDNELRIQAHGTKKLLAMTGRSDIKDFLLVSIGTGTSYTIVRSDEVVRYPFGNGIGGGFVKGIMQLAGIEMSTLAYAGAADFSQSLDLLVRDVISDTAGTTAGEIIISHFGKVSSREEPPQNIIYSALNCLATAVVRDILKLGLTRDYQPPEHVVFVGSTVGKCGALEKMFEDYFRYLSGKPWQWQHKAIFPPHAEYAGAIGALFYGR